MSNSICDEQAQKIDLDYLLKWLADTEPGEQGGRLPQLACLGAQHPDPAGVHPNEESIRRRQNANSETNKDFPLMAMFTNGIFCKI